jgi:hypothetical protein
MLMSTVTDVSEVNIIYILGYIKRRLLNITLSLKLEEEYNSETPPTQAKLTWSEGPSFELVLNCLFRRVFLNSNILYTFFNSWCYDWIVSMQKEPIEIIYLSTRLTIFLSVRFIIDIIFERHIVYWNTNRLYVRLHNFLVYLFIQDGR